MDYLPGTAQVVSPFPERLVIVPFRTFRHRRDIVRCLPDKRLQHFQPVAILQQLMEIDLLLLPFVAQASRTDLQQLFHGERFFQAGREPRLMQVRRIAASRSGGRNDRNGPRVSHIGCAKQFQHVEPVHLRHFQVGNHQVIILTADAFHQVTYAPACRAHHPMVREHLLDGGQQDGIVVQRHDGKRLYEGPGAVFFLHRLLRG